MKYSHQTYERFMSGRSRKYKQPRGHDVQVEVESVYYDKTILGVLRNLSQLLINTRFPEIHDLTRSKIGQDFLP